LAFIAWITGVPSRSLLVVVEPAATISSSKSIASKAIITVGLR
jgi:hypothetical protein